MIHHSPNVIGPVYIRLNNEPVRAALPYFCERVIRGVNVLIVVNANLRAAFCQLQCYGPANPPRRSRDRKSTRLNSSHSQISYAVFCLKKKKTTTTTTSSSHLLYCTSPAP